MNKKIISPQRFNIEVEQLQKIITSMFHPCPKVEQLADWVAVKYGYKNKQHFLEMARKFNSDKYVWSLSPMTDNSHSHDDVSEVVRKWFLETEDNIIVHNDAVNKQNMDPMIFLIGVINELMDQLDVALESNPQLKSIWRVSEAAHFKWSDSWDQKVLLIRENGEEKEKRAIDFLLAGTTARSIDLNELAQNDNLRDEFISEVDSLTSYETIQVNLKTDEDILNVYPLLVSTSISNVKWLLVLQAKEASEENLTGLMGIVDMQIALG